MEQFKVTDNGMVLLSQWMTDMIEAYRGNPDLVKDIDGRMGLACGILVAYISQLEDRIFTLENKFRQ